MIRRLALVTDAWHPQVNGVVNTLSRLTKHLESQGTEVLVISPDGHRTVPLPLDPDYRLAYDPWHAIPRIRDFRPDAIHVATEGPLGFWTNQWLRRRGMRFTTSFHTRFPEYLSARMPVPLWVGYCIERWFHRPATQIVITCSDPNVTDPPTVIELAELKLTREQVSPEWLAMHDAEKKRESQ